MTLTFLIGWKMCLDCAEGFHSLCTLGCTPCHGKLSEQIVDSPEASDTLEADQEIDRVRKTRKGKNKNDAKKKARDRELKDPQSTGRHRAVTLHGKADPSQPCEWQEMANCGGGSFPILGCVSGVQENLHHGPDKNTLNNERNNIHKICSRCHNRWHTLNDPGYEWDGHHAAHSPREPTLEDIKLDNERWKTVVIKNVKRE